MPLTAGRSAADVPRTRDQPEERLLPDFRTLWPWKFDSLVLALSIIRRNQDARE